MRLVLSFSFLFFLSSCVSVGLSKPKITPSKTLQFKAPDRPFQEVSLPDVQNTWKSEDTSNIITLQSDCNPDNEVTLESLEADAKSAFDRAQTQSTKELTFQNRRALRSRVDGDIDGVLLSMEILTLKKDGCRYVVTFSGKTIQSELPIFETFINGLNIP